MWTPEEILLIQRLKSLGRLRIKKVKRVHIDSKLLKLKTNEIEQQHLIDGNRRLNIDPGYISPERLILATGKNYVHRVYLKKGIYADLTLVFQKGSFRPLKWTYPDYAAPEIIGFFNEIRERYMVQIREMRRIDLKHDSLWQKRISSGRYAFHCRN